MASVTQWKKTFGHNINKIFWPILSTGLRYSLIEGNEGVDSCNVDDDLYPETLLLGLIDYVCSTLNRDLTRPKRGTSLNDYRAKNQWFDDLLLHTKGLSDLVLKPIITKDVSHSDAESEGLRKKLSKNQSRHQNRFARQIRALLEQSMQDGRIVDLSEVFQLCVDNHLNSSSAEQKKKLKVEQYVSLEQKIRDEVVGQDLAVDTFVRGLFEGDLRFGEKTGPRSSFLFVGPPGVGKTFLATVAAKALNRPTKVFSMSEYAQREDFHALIGFEYTWRNSEPGKLTSFVSTHPNAVLIFDEVEKGHINTLRQFLTMLDAGFITDLYTAKDVSFKNTVCIFTTNAGRAFYEDNRERKISTIPEATLIDALKKDVGPNGRSTLPTELLSRLAKGYIVGFDHMEPHKLLPIIERRVDNAIGLYEERANISVNIDKGDFERFCHILMFHLGDQIDARVATSRSNMQLVDTVYDMLENVTARTKALIEAGEDAEMQDWNKVDITIGIKDDDEIVQKLLLPDETQKQRFIVVSSVEKQQELAPGPDDCYELLDWWTLSDDQKLRNISALLQAGMVDAILVDPSFSKLHKPAEFEGEHHMKTRANAILSWLMQQRRVPPTYLLLKEGSTLDLNLAERDEFYAMGVVDSVHMDSADLGKLALTIFLLKNLRSVTSKGRTLNFKTGHRKTGENSYTIELHDFSLVPSMDTGAADIVVNRTVGTKDTTFDDVIGADSAKEELRQFISFLENPDSYLNDGLTVSRGILLYGRPGTGKTLLARALASEADCPFIPVSGADVTSIAEDGDKVRDIAGLFRLARRYAPCVLFIDEIDAFARPRSTATVDNIAKVNKMLTEMDGFAKHEDRPVFVIAATNFEPEDLDPALMRRFSKRVHVGLPSETDRIQYLRNMKVKLKGKKYGLDELDKDEAAAGRVVAGRAAADQVVAGRDGAGQAAAGQDGAGQVVAGQVVEHGIKRIARVTAGASIADIENAIHLAQGRAAEIGSPVTVDLLQDCYEEMKYGEKIKDIVQTLKSTAYHEAGHVLMSFAAGERFWPSYATVVGRRRFLGAVFPREDTKLKKSKGELLSEIRICLGGRAAEIVCFGDEEVGNGAKNDLARASRLALEMLCSDGLEEGFLMSVSPDTVLSGPLAGMYLQRANEILARELDRTIEYLRDHEETLEAVGEGLLRKSRLNMLELYSIVMPEEGH